MAPKILFTVLLFYSCQLAFSQQLQYNQENSFIPVWPANYVTEYKGPTKIPAVLSKIANDILPLRTGRHAASMEIKNCTVINLAQYYKDHPDSAYKNFMPATSYTVKWGDKQVGAENYVFSIMLDSYNQVVYMGFPNEYKTEGFDFLCLDSAKAMADQLIVSDTITYSSPEISMYYDFSENDMIWSFNYPVKQDENGAVIITEDGETTQITDPQWPTTRIIDYSMRRHTKFREDGFIYFEF